MKLKVISKEDNIRINLHLPLCMIKTRFITNVIFKNTNMVVDCKVVKKIYRQLKKYIKKNGHFDLLEVCSTDGTIVKITV